MGGGGMLGSPAVLEVERARGGWLRRHRANRRISVQSRSPLLWVAGVVQAVWRAGLRVVRLGSKVLLVAAAIVAVVGGTRLGFRHVVDSPRFQLRSIEFAPTAHLGPAEVAALAG